MDQWWSLQFLEKLSRFVAIGDLDDELGSANKSSHPLTPNPSVSVDIHFDLFENRKYIKEQLSLLRHAHSCKKWEILKFIAPYENYICPQRDCSHMKIVVEHLSACTAGKECTFTHCYSSKQIIAHWANCTRQDCPVCGPFNNVRF